ncbi:hypothetical protein EJB05_50393, partial [Eragrostis curvula]
MGRDLVSRLRRRLQLRLVMLVLLGKEAIMVAERNEWSPTIENLGDAATTPIREQLGSNDVAPKVDHVKDPRSLLCYDDEVLGDLTDEDVTTFELGKQLVPKICLKNMPWEMKKLHHWYMQAAKEGVSMIPLKYGSDIFNDMEPEKANIMGITFDEIYHAFRLQRINSTLVTLWCIDHWICLCLIPTNGYLLVLDSLDVDKKRYQDIISVIDCAYANYCKAGGKHSPYRDKYMYFRHKFWCYKQPRGSVHCGYYTYIFSQNSSKYLYTITEETKEEKEQRMK